jgi:hypothetical protein
MPSPTHSIGRSESHDGRVHRAPASKAFREDFMRFKATAIALAVVAAIGYDV